jgi:hypothetical protein
MPLTVKTYHLRVSALLRRTGRDCKSAASTAQWCEAGEAVLAASVREGASVANIEKDLGAGFDRIAVIRLFRDGPANQAMWNELTDAVLDQAGEDVALVARLEKAIGMDAVRAADLDQHERVPGLPAVKEPRPRLVA